MLCLLQQWLPVLRRRSYFCSSSSSPRGRHVPRGPAPWSASGWTPGGAPSRCRREAHAACWRSGAAARGTRARRRRSAPRRSQGWWRPTSASPPAGSTGAPSECRRTRFWTTAPSAGCARWNASPSAPT